MTPSHNRLSNGAIAILVIAAVIILDQFFKIWVKTHFYLGEDLPITSWFQLNFIENNGMAFGMEMGSKLFLTLFRIVAVTAIGYYLWLICRNPRYSVGYIVCVALVLAGAMGNIFDCIFYGVIFNNPMPPAVATMFPPEGGYAPFFHGRVVDMLYFPLVSFDWPDWMPWFGGEHFIFFQPVFNLADAAITVGMIVLIFFFSKYMAYPVRQSVTDTATDDTESES
ncbi:MAG: lipoprotein signal peptidase [Bacteroides sp.]|nr:lipoprotein signal peptidase [Bacteroides sp.]